MAYRLCDRVSFCVAGGQTVFLDVRRDRYFYVGGSAALALWALVDQTPVSQDGVDKLTGAGLIESAGEGARIEPTSAALPSHSLLEDGSAEVHVRPGTVLEAAWALARSRTRLKRRPFASVLDELGKRRLQKGARAALPSKARLSVAASYNAARRLVPIKPVCLLDSLALLECLARRGLFADLVFGVKSHPFGAHCWVQAGDVVLNDAIDHVTAFTPILVVG